MIFIYKKIKIPFLENQILVTIFFEYMSPEGPDIEDEKIIKVVISRHKSLLEDEQS